MDLLRKFYIFTEVRSSLTFL